MKRLLAVAVVVAVVGVVDFARADDKPDPTGTWKWTVTGRRPMEMTLKLKLDGDTLTGAMVGRNNKETPIEDAQYKDRVVSFKVVRERNGQKTTTTYNGTLSGDTIKGKIESTGRDGKTHSHDWEAKRVKT
jgi:hypothetical protein